MNSFKFQVNKSVILLLTMIVFITAPISANASWFHAGKAVAGALAGNKQFRKFVIGSGILTGAGGTILTNIFGGDEDASGNSPTPAENSSQGKFWITNGLTGSISATPQGSCNLLNEGYGVKSYFDGGYKCTIYSPNLGGGSITHNTWIYSGNLWDNPKLEGIANDIVNQAMQGNEKALDIVRASEPPAPFDIDNASNDDLISWLKNNNTNSDDPTNSGGGTGTTGENSNGTGNQDQGNTSGGGTGTTGENSNGTGNQDQGNTSGGGTGTTGENSNGTGNQDQGNTSGGGSVDKLQLPKFCDWAKFICDDTIKDDKDTKIDIGDNDFDFTPIAEKPYVVLPKQCPANPKIGFTMPFVNERFELEFPLDIFCHFFALFKPVIIMYAYIRALVIIGKD